MRNNGDDFLAKFGNRVQKIGKDGVMGIMKNTGPTINNNNIIFQNLMFNAEYHKNMTYKPNRNIFDQNNPYFNSQGISNINNMNGQSIRNNNDFLNSYKTNNYNNYGNNCQPLIYSCQINKKSNPILNENNIYYVGRNKKKHEIGNNLQNIIGKGYKPYTIEDYKKINNEVNMGKLGADFRSKQWSEKKERMQKMSEYGKQVMIKRKGHYLKMSQSYEDDKSNFHENKNENEKWNNINEYQREISENKKYNKKQFNININNIFKRDLFHKINNKDENGHGIGSILKQHSNINYRRKLKNVKNILF